jgi:capsular exopolysaccharide synthesis family protein
MTPASDPDRAPDAGRTMREYAAAVWRRRGLVLLLAVLGTAAGWWQGARSPDVYAVSTLIDMTKPRPFASAPTMGFGEGYHESQLYYPTRYKLLESRTYVDRLFASRPTVEGRRYPMWDWLTWPAVLAARPEPEENESFGPAVQDAVEFEALVRVPLEEFRRRFAFRRYGANPTPAAEFDDPADLRRYLDGRVVVRPEKNTALLTVELEGERRELLAPLLNLLIDVFWREQRSETQKRLDLERRFWVRRHVSLVGTFPPEERVARPAEPADTAAAEAASPLGRAARELEDWKRSNGSNAQRLRLLENARSTQVVEDENELRDREVVWVAAQADRVALVPDAAAVEAAAVARAREAATTRRRELTPAEVERAVDEAWVSALARVETEVASVADGADSRFHAIPFVTADPKVASLVARMAAVRVEGGNVQAIRRELTAAVRDVVLRRVRELTSTLADRMLFRDRMVRGTADLEQNWRLADELATRQKALDDRVAERTRIRDQLDRIRNQVAVDEDSKPLKVAIPAEDPWEPVKPNRPLLIVLGAVVGMFMGLALALLLDWLDDTVSEPEDVARYVGAPVVGTVLTMPGREADRVAAEQPRSPVAEAFRAVRTSLEFLGAGVEGDGVPGRGRVILVSSCSPREGKTTVASNLAIVLAQDGKRTLLVDADLRKPRAHEVLNVDRTRGLSNVIVGQASLAESVQATAFENLWVLPAGALPPNPAELLGRRATLDLIEAVRGSFDRIVVDTPPVGVVTDAAVLARHADTVVLVLAAGRTKKKAAEHGASVLRSVGTPPTGVVMNLVGRNSPLAHGGYYDRRARGYYGATPET